MWRSRMFWQLFGSNAILILFSLVLFSYLALSQMERNERSDIEAQLQDKALLIQEAIRLRNPTQEQEILQRIRSLSTPLPRRITLFDCDNRILADTSPHVDESEIDIQELANVRKEGIAHFTRARQANGSEWMYVALHADLPGSQVDIIRMAYPLDNLQAHVQELRRLVWVAAGLTALIALVLAFWSAHGITRPVRELIGGAEKIAAGNYGYRVYSDSVNEVGVLARTFNYMSDRLSEQFTQLEEDRQQLRTVLSSMIEGVIAIDHEQRILFANERASVLLDFPLRSAMGRHLWEMVRQRTLQDMLRGMMNTEVHRGELKWAGPGERSLTVYMARLPGPVSRGGAVLVFHDTTDLRRLEKLRQEFVANVSHELKTPLTIIQANIETLIDGAVDDISYRGQFLLGIANETARLDHLTSDLLQLARVESETEVFEKEALDIEEIVLACLSRHRTLAEGKKQSLEAIPPAHRKDKILVWGDEESMLQILNNLVTNALKYTPEAGRVSVSWRQEQDDVILEVRDTGIGIDPSDLQRIFERFYRADKARSREFGGTGLGLSIVKHLAQAMQGSVRATSEKGKGSTFTVVLPVPNLAK